MRLQNFSIIVGLAALVGACGGGGSASAPAPAATAALSASNQATAAQDTAAVAFTPFTGAQTLTGAQIIDESVIFSAAREQLAQLPTYMANAKANSTLAGATVSTTVSCASGFLAVLVNDADSSGTVSAGDSLTITSNSCVNAAGNALTGSLAFTVNSASGTFSTSSNVYSLGVTMTFNSFGVTAPSSFNGTVNGSLTLSVNSTALNTFTETVSTPSLTVSGSFLGVSRTRTLANYSATAARTPVAPASFRTSYSINGAVTSTALSSQTILFATTTNFVSNGTDAYPSSGVIVLTGANSTKLRVTAISNTQVTEELDPGTGTYGAPVTVNWNQLI